MPVPVEDALCTTTSLDLRTFLGRPSRCTSRRGRNRPLAMHIDWQTVTLQVVEAPAPAAFRHQWSCRSARDGAFRDDTIAEVRCERKRRARGAHGPRRAVCVVWLSDPQMKSVRGRITAGPHRQPSRSRCTPKGEEKIPLRLTMNTASLARFIRTTPAPSAAAPGKPESHPRTPGSRDPGPRALLERRSQATHECHPLEGDPLR